MALSKEELVYYLANFRTRRSYMMFHIFQVILSFLIIICALSSANHFRQTSVLVMEFILLLCMAFDLLVVRRLTEGAIWTNKRNKIDAVILIIFAATFLFLLMSDKKHSDDTKNSVRDVLLEADDVLIIIIVLGRYVVQLYQMVTAIKNTRRNMILGRKMKDIDLNNKDPHQSIVYDQEEIKQDQIVRSKLQEKYRNSHEEEREQN